MRTTFLISIFFLLASTGNSQEIKLRSSNRLVLGIHEELTSSVSAGDIDGDGDTDLVLANGRHWPGQNRIFLNNGRGIFTVSYNLGSEESTSYAAGLTPFPTGLYA